MIEAKVSCPACKKVVPCLEKDMAVAPVTGPDKEELRLTTWTCPECGRTFHVQLDDETTSSLLNSIKLHISRMRRKIQMGKMPSHSEVGHVTQLQEALAENRTALSTRYDKTLVYQSAGDELRLELCVPEAMIAGEKETKHAEI